MSKLTIWFIRGVVIGWLLAVIGEFADGHPSLIGNGPIAGAVFGGIIGGAIGIFSAIFG